MAERSSALDGHLSLGISGLEGRDGPGVMLELLRESTLSQVAAWPDTVDSVASELREAIGIDTVPGPGKAVEMDSIAVLRIEPLKCWIVGAKPPSIDPSIGTSLDLSHSRTRVRVSGSDATALLNRFLPLDLRDSSFPSGSVASSAMHHVGVTLWCNSSGYDLFIPRGFALSTWEVLLESAKQFGVSVSEAVSTGAGG